MKTLSSTKWEDSYFGGYRKVLYDYPSIATPFDMHYECDSDRKFELGYYSFDKLMDLFHLRVKELNLSGHLLTGAKVRVKHDYFGNKMTQLVAESAKVKQCLEHIKVHDCELANLFDHFGEYILSTSFVYTVNEEKKKKKGDEDGDNDDKIRNKLQQ